jgi:hypothetical protein
MNPTFSDLGPKPVKIKDRSIGTTTGKVARAPTPAVPRTVTGMRRCTIVVLLSGEQC